MYHSSLCLIYHFPQWKDFNVMILCWIPSYSVLFIHCVESTNTVHLNSKSEKTLILSKQGQCNTKLSYMALKLRIGKTGGTKGHIQRGKRQKEEQKFYRIIIKWKVKGEKGVKSDYLPPTEINSGKTLCIPKMTIYYDFLKESKGFLLVLFLNINEIYDFAYLKVG